MRWKKQRDNDLERELRSHLEVETAEQREAGLPADQAGHAAQRALGNTTAIREEIREMWNLTSLERLAQDLRYAARMFVHNPAFVAIAVLSMALGIGGNAAVFSLVNTLLIRSLPYPQPDELLRITKVYPKAALPMFQEQSRAMDIASASPGSDFNLTGVGKTVRVLGSSVSANLFSVLRAPVTLGRAFETGEQRPGADRTVILSHGLWMTEFSSDPQIVGAMITLNGVTRQIVGVMPAAFGFPSTKVQLWIPAKLDPTDFEDYWGKEYEPFIARLRAGATLPQAQGEVHAIVQRLQKQFPFPMPHNWNGDATAIPLQADLVGEIRGKLTVLFAAVGIVLLIACTNVSSLLLSRATARRKEIALRTALGASRFRIVRQLLTESVLLAALGAAVGLLVGAAALSVFKSALPSDTPGMSGVQIDWQVAGFVSALAALTGLAFGMAPALSASRVDLAGAIKTGSARSSTTAWARLRGCLLIAEVSLTVVLVVSAGLLLKSLYAMSRVNPGFDPERVLTVRLSPNQSSCAQPASCIALYDRLLGEARGISGVSDVAVANTIPLDGQIPSLPFDVEGHPKTADFPAPLFWAGAITPDYFQMLHIPLREGRGFTAADGAKSSAVVVITASTARRFWPDQSAVGKHIKTVWDTQWRTVIGVADDVRQFNLTGRDPEGIGGAVYMPYPQSVQADHQIPAAMDLLVKTAAPPTRIAGEVRQMARDLDPNSPAGEVTTLAAVVSGSTADFQSTIWVFLSFAAASLLLAAIGIYGLVSNSVAQRTYEIGLRVAIGATRQEILQLMLKQSLRLTLIGIVAGVAASLAVTRFLSSLLYGVAPTDPVTFTTVCAMMLAIAVMASYVPAWRAANLDPIKSLRVE
jgi:putative ABC transport system permease protein